jgi:hypothetical protein
MTLFDTPLLYEGGQGGQDSRLYHYQTRHPFGGNDAFPIPPSCMRGARGVKIPACTIIKQDIPSAGMTLCPFCLCASVPFYLYPQYYIHAEYTCFGMYLISLFDPRFTPKHRAAMRGEQRTMASKLRRAMRG